MAVPTGIITIWYDVIEKIPSGWALCDGTNGTPDLRDKFVYGASLDDEVGVTSGSLVHNHTSIPLSSNSGHTHSISGTSGLASGTSSLYLSSGLSIVTGQHSHNYTGNTNTQGEHSHTITGNSSFESNLPLYVKLFYIMKL